MFPTIGFVYENTCRSQDQKKERMEKIRQKQLQLQELILQVRVSFSQAVPPGVEVDFVLKIQA